MSKIKTTSESCVLREWSSWERVSGGGYSGLCRTRFGLIQMQVRPRSALATFTHMNRRHTLKADNPVTRLGWTRIVKKWVRGIVGKEKE